MPAAPNQVARGEKLSKGLPEPGGRVNCELLFVTKTEQPGTDLTNNANRSAQTKSLPGLFPVLAKNQEYTES